MPQRSPDYQPGQAIPGTVYRVHRVLGAGGMGTVYDVEDTSVGKRYVLKTLHGDLADRSDLAARLAREARALAKLQHPNIVEVYTSGTTQDSLRLPYYVMERLQGQSLRTVIERKGRLTVEQACDIGIDLLDALDHAHEFGIIHRDVKPDNIFITRGRDGRSLAKLLDFGIIKLATGPGSSATMHTGGRFIGTFRYAPPEQILGRDVTPRSDLYAAGLVIYEMIAGRGPFDDFTGEMEIGKAHIDVAPPTLSRFATVTPVVEQIVMSALQKDPSLRPRDAFSFASALRDVKKQLAGAPVSSSRTQAATVEQVVVQPVSAARPATPFGAIPSGIFPASAGPVAESVPASSQETRIDAPAGMNAATAMAPSRTNTVSLGVLPIGAYGVPPQETLASAPLDVTAGAAPIPVMQAPAPIDRRAETREAAPQPVQRPHYDTAPIPLAVFAQPRPEPGSLQRASETFGAHTTETSQRKKAARGALVAVLVGVFVATGGALATFFVWHQHHTAATAAPAPSPVVTTTEHPTATDTQPEPATSTAAVTATATATAAATATTATAAATEPHHAHTHTATAPTHTQAAASPVVTSAPPPATTASPPVHHLPGSGL
ncbi:MAG TPA: protein kinase [Polyangiaceae bacterium]|jgi:serine/threonine-protein kinase